MKSYLNGKENKRKWNLGPQDKLTVSTHEMTFGSNASLSSFSLELAEMNFVLGEIRVSER